MHYACMPESHLCCIACMMHGAVYSDWPTPMCTFPLPSLPPIEDGAKRGSASAMICWVVAASSNAGKSTMRGYQLRIFGEDGT